VWCFSLIKVKCSARMELRYATVPAASHTTRRDMYTHTPARSLQYVTHTHTHSSTSGRPTRHRQTHLRLRQQSKEPQQTALAPSDRKPGVCPWGFTLLGDSSLMSKACADAGGVAAATASREWCPGFTRWTSRRRRWCEVADLGGPGT
jgi:hypothetical protein